MLHSSFEPGTPQIILAFRLTLLPLGDGTQTCPDEDGFVTAWLGFNPLPRCASLLSPTPRCARLPRRSGQAAALLPLFSGQPFDEIRYAVWLPSVSLQLCRCNRLSQLHGALTSSCRCRELRAVFSLLQLDMTESGGGVRLVFAGVVGNLLWRARGTRTYAALLSCWPKSWPASEDRAPLW